MHVGTLPPRIEPAPPLIFAGAHRPFARGEVQVFPVADGLVRIHARPADALDEQAGNRECVVAHEFRVEPEAALARDLAVKRVALAQFLRRCGSLLIGVARYDQPDEMLHIPAAFDKLRGEPVEQLGIHWRLTLRAHIVEDFGKAGAEIHFPQPVHEHARRQRIFRRDNPLGEIEPRELAVFDLRLRQEGRHTGLHGFAAFIEPVSAR